MLKCPFCGSCRIKTIGGENGDPFDRRPEKTVCLDCGRTLGTDAFEPDNASPKISSEELEAMDELTKSSEE